MEDDFILEGSHVVPVDIVSEMEKSYLEYSMSVIVGRALPDVRDGLKPVHRRILYRMHEMLLRPENPYRKCADIVGGVLGSYHPHGDSSVYDALVRMAQIFSMRYPLVDGQGNFGSIDGDSAAAYRYTEAKMSKISMHMLGDMNEETVDMRPNYDERLMEPVVLPARFPNLLVNGSSGIAVGMATNIPPHNLKETIGAVCHLIDNPDADTKDLMQHLKGPDFPTGGLIMGRSGIFSAYDTGRGKITLRAKTEIVEKANERHQIIVTEIPYQVNKARLIQSIAEQVTEKRIEGIADLQDQSSNRVGLRIVMDLKRDAMPEIILNQLFQLTQMQVTVGVIMLALYEENGSNRPKIMTLKEILTHYIEFQKEIITRKSIFQLGKARERAHILAALHKALDIIDEVIKTIRASRDAAHSRENLVAKFDFDEIQAAAIVEMRLRQLSGLEREKIEKELAELEAKIIYLEDLLAHEEKILEVVKEDNLAVAEEFKDERRTAILEQSGTVEIEDLIPVEDCVITLTHYGYIKRQPVDVYRTQKRGGRGVSGMNRRDDDFVEELFICSSHDYVMFFTDKGKMYRLKCYEIPEGSRNSRGTNIVNILELEEDEQIKAMIRVDDALEDGKFITMVTENGIIKRTALTEFKNVRKTGVISIVMDDDDELAFARLTEDEDELIVATYLGMGIRFSQKDVRAIGRTTRGVKAISLTDGDYVVGMAVVEEDMEILTVTEKGYGRRTKMDGYRTQNRGGKGSINYKVNEEKGNVVGVRTVNDDYDIMMIADNGIIIKIGAEDISTYSRYSGGVRVMRLENETRLVTFAASLKETDDNGIDEENTDGENTDGENLETIDEENTDGENLITIDEENIAEPSDDKETD